VEPEDVHSSLKAVRAGGGFIAARRDRAGRILGVDDVAQVLGQFRPIPLGDLVADAPHYYAGMVPLALDHRLQVLGVPLVEESAVVAASLALLPAVEGLDHHDEPHSIGQVEQFGRGRVVRGPQRVATHLLEDFELPLQRAKVQRRTERAEIMMVARAIQRNSAAIELETVARCELDRAEAKGLVVAIDDLLALPDGGSCEVAVWRGKVPSPWIRNGRSR